MHTLLKSSPPPLFSPSAGDKIPNLIQHYFLDDQGDIGNNKRQSSMNNNDNSTSSSSSASPTRSGTSSAPEGGNGGDDRGHRLAVAHGGLYFFRSLVWDLLESGKYSDFTIRVIKKGSSTPREFCVHRAIVCPQSKIFEAACRGEFVEASTNTITLNDDDPEIVEQMIKYFYTHRYDDDEDWEYYRWNPTAGGIRPATKTGDGIEQCESGEAAQERSSSNLSSRKKHFGYSAGYSYSPDSEYGNATVPNSLRVYAIADKYLVLPLKELARIRFTKWAAHHWSSPRFLSAVREIFDGETGNYAELQEAVIAPLVRHADELLFNNHNYNDDNDNDRNDDDDNVGQLLHDYGEISLAVLRRVLERSRIAQRGLEVDVAELQSRVEALQCENRKIDVLQSQNRRLTKELLEMKMALISRRRGREASSSRGERSSRTHVHHHHR